MGQKDLTEKNLEYYPDVFADIVNALLYQGNQIVNSKELLPAPTETMYYSQKGKLRNQFHDVSKFATKYRVIQVQYTLENETRAARKMIFRRIGGLSGSVGQQGRLSFCGACAVLGQRKMETATQCCGVFFFQRAPSGDLEIYQQFSPAGFFHGRTAKGRA